MQLVEGTVQEGNCTVPLKAAMGWESNTNDRLPHETPSPTHIIPNLAQVPSEELTKAQRRARALLPLAELSTAERLARFRELAASGELGVRSVRSVRRLYDQLIKGREVKGQPRAGPLALVRPHRADKGKPRIPEELFKLVVMLWLMHPNAAAPKLLRIVELNDPALLSYRKRKTHRLSASTIRRTRRWMERVPELRYALMNADERHEFHRIWAGEVLTERACELWMADMTRCDVFVFDPNEPEPSMYRLRIHAIIDVYSGAVPAFVFSRQEDQSATDRMLFLAVHEKPGVWAEHWPVYGRPETLYWDNGRVYRSKKSEQVCADLGIRLINSRPYVSHSRGNIERLFATFHQTHEKLLPGYAGKDATDKSGKELDRLWKNTLKWLERGGPDPYPERLLTEDEYKRKALVWLVTEYHRTLHLGKTPVEHYLETAPVSARAVVSFDELMTLFSNREVRTVEGNGWVRWRNRKWALSDASLVKYQRQKIVILANELVPGAEQIKAALELPDGNLAILGDLVPYGGSALDEANRAYRQAAKGVLSDLAARAEDVLETWIDPEWRHDRVQERAFGLSPEPLVIEPAPRATLAALNPEERRAKQLEEDRKALEAEGLKLDWDVDIPSERRRE